jgi:hypothetical protein
MAIIAGVIALVSWAATTPPSTTRTPGELVMNTPTPVTELNQYFKARWLDQGYPVPKRADELQILRRLSLTLHGTVPSLEEIRQFEADTRPDKIERWTERMLKDKRFGPYFAERLARTIVGVEQGPFLVYRRDRFVDWLGTEIQANRRWSEITKQIISGRGLWTGSPQTNFISVALANDELDVNKLAGRTTRAFLGQRIDCAQCHDHPFDDWLQTDFEGLAAFYSEATFNIAGIRDQNSFLFNIDVRPPDEGDVPPALRGALGRNDKGLAEKATVIAVRPEQVWVLADGTPPTHGGEDEEPIDGFEEDDAMEFRPRYLVRKVSDRQYSVHDFEFEHAFVDQHSTDLKVIDPNPPFNPEWVPEDGTRRQKLAAWVTNENNERFGRAISNRVWGLMFGRPYFDPVDDLPDPGDSGTVVLDILAADFRNHDDSLHRLIRTIAASDVFQAASTTGELSSPADYENMKSDFAVFPLVRLRPEQVIGSMLQASNVRTINQNSHLFVRIQRFFGEINFVQEYGDLGDDELTEGSGTIPQALLRMNGDMTREQTKVDAFTTPRRILALSGSDENIIENCFLACLTRRPTEAERDHFLTQLKDVTGTDRDFIMEDLYWSLFNSDEFSWNH